MYVFLLKEPIHVTPERFLFSAMNCHASSGVFEKHFWIDKQIDTKMLQIFVSSQITETRRVEHKKVKINGMK